MEQIIYIISFLLSSSNYIVGLSIPLYLISKFSASPLILGIAGFLGNFSYTIFTYIFYRKRLKIHFPWFVISSILITFAYFSLTLIKSYIFFFLILFLNGIFYSRFWPSIQYFFSKNIEKVDRYNLSWSIGTIFGTFISGYLFKMREFLPFMVGSFFAFISFIISKINFKKFYEFYKKLPEKFFVENKIDRYTKKIMFLNFINFFGIGGTLYLFPKLAKIIGYPSPLISNILTSLFLIRFFMFWIFSKIKVKFTNVILSISYILVFISLFFTGIIKVPFLHFIFISILGVSCALSYRITIITVIEKGYSTELNESIIGIGFFTGSLIVGILGQIFGIFNGFILSSILILIIFLFQKFLLK
ncbi:MAG: MFS transporter [Candidatus Omnitrophica bacterium]|nr:MFS transporter [Candidatus Omnitrophota bacterium]